jgi:phosphonate transport system permease protein
MTDREDTQLVEGEPLRSHGHDGPPPSAGQDRAPLPQAVARTIGLIALLLVLSWAWHKSDIDPALLVSNRDRAAEYVFGTPIDDAQRARLRDNAERTARLELLADAQDAVRADLGLADLDPLPPEGERSAIDRATADRAALPPDEWTERVDRIYADFLAETRGGYFPPETDPERVAGYADALLETLAIAIWGTVLAAIAALFASLFVARRTLEIVLPGDRWDRVAIRWSLHCIGRRAFDVCRGFNEIVLALIFVAVLGLGPFAGMLALAVHGFGVLGKIFADAIEIIRMKEVEGVTATGASPSQIISFAVVPQIVPYVVSQTLLRFESNVRSATVLGIVGAGGIGFLIDAKLKAYQYREVATMMILIVVLVSLIDLACGRIMKRFT